MAPIQVLIVDDEPDIRDALAELLSEEGYEVRHAEDGAAARRLLDQGLVPDVILLDVVMPNVNGSKLYESLSADLRRRVIVSTASPRVWSHGGIMLNKPFDLLELIATVRRVARDTRAATSLRAV